MAKNIIQKNPIMSAIIAVVALAVFSVIPPFNLPVLNVEIGPDLFNIGGDSATDADAEVASGRQVPSDSIILKLSTELTGAQATNNIEVYEAGTDPTNPSATKLATITVGTAYTTADLTTNTVYRVVYNNGTDAYAHDFGDIVLIPEKSFNSDTGDSVVDLTAEYNVKRRPVASLTDILDETSATLINGADPGNSSGGATEITCSTEGCAANEDLVYDESVGDGTFYIDFTFAAGGSQSFLDQPVTCFRHATSNAPEGNEISAITVTRQSGTDVGFAPGTDWSAVWSNGECVAMNNMQSGDSGVYRFTFTVNEGNLDANDDWTLVFDDLGDDLAKDGALNIGATSNTVTFDAQA